MERLVIYNNTHNVYGISCVNSLISLEKIEIPITFISLALSITDKL